MESNYQIIDRFSGSEIFQKAKKLKKSINCKFIILRNEDNFILIYGDLYRYPYHANLLEYYCNLNGIQSGWNKKPDDYEIYESSYMIMGGGWMDINILKNKIKIYGQSTAYGKYDHVILENVLLNSDDLSSYEFSIEKR